MVFGYSVDDDEKVNIILYENVIISNRLSKWSLSFWIVEEG